MLKRVQHSPEIDLSSWEDGEGEGVLPLVMMAVWAIATKTLREVFEEFEKNTVGNGPYFPHLWREVGNKDEDGIGGPVPDDPLTIYIGLPLGQHTDETPQWSLTITECIDDLIDGHQNPETKKIDFPYAEGIIAIRDALRAQAQRIDDVLAQAAR